MNKKIISAAVAAMLVASMCPASALAAPDALAGTAPQQEPFVAADVTAAATSGTCGKNATWELSSTGVLTISGTGALECDYKWSWDSDIKSLIIGEGITSISDHAFENCVSLKTISLPRSLKAIGRSAFEDCDALVSIAIPDSVTSIGGYAFNGCMSLSSVSFSDNFPVEGMGAFAFSWGKGSKSLPLPSSWTKIPEGYFAGSNIKTIALPKNLKAIEGYAFNGCEHLESIVVPEGVTKIGDSAFSGCTALKSIALPKGLQASGVGSMVFFGCANLDTPPLPSGWTEIPDGYFAGLSMKSFSIPSGVTRIGEEAFKYCEYLESIHIPEGVTYIGNSAFRYCNALSSLCLPESLKTIGGYSFKNCHSLESVTIPGRVTKVGYEAFSFCDNLVSVTIPDKFPNGGMDSDAFAYSEKLKTLPVPSSWTKIPKGYFKGTGVESVEIPSNIQSLEWESFAECASLKSVSIPEGVTSIGGEAFSGCSSLESVSIPEGVTSIGGFAFSGCSSLKSISVPEGVTSIEGYTFYGCSSLKSVSIPKRVTSIEDFAFYKCSSLKSVSIPEGVTSIGESAFRGCSSLSEVVLPKSVKRIYGNAFKGLAAGSAIYTWNSAIAKLKSIVSPSKTSFVLLGSKSIAVSKRVSAVSYSSLTSKTCSPIASVTGAKGDRSFAKLEGAEGLSVDPATGKVKVAKGTPAGQYKLKVRVLVGPYGDRAYGLSKDVAVTVKVTRVEPLITVSKIKAAVALPVSSDKECQPIQSATCRAGAVQSYELVAAANLATGNSTSKVRVDPLTGKVTVLKGAKAGKYSLRIKLTSPETENYKSGSKTVACTVFVGIKG